MVVGYQTEKGLWMVFWKLTSQLVLPRQKAKAQFAYVVSHCTVNLMKISGVQLLARDIAGNVPCVSQLECVYTLGINTRLGMDEVDRHVLHA